MLNVKAIFTVKCSECKCQAKNTQQLSDLNDMSAVLGKSIDSFKQYGWKFNNESDPQHTASICPNCAELVRYRSE